MRCQWPAASGGVLPWAAATFQEKLMQGGLMTFWGHRLIHPAEAQIVLDSAGAPDLQGPWRFGQSPGAGTS